MSHSLIASTATQVTAQLSTGELSLNDVKSALRAQYATVNEHINAFEFIAAQSSVPATAPFHGLPITVKDQIAVAGMPVNYGLDKVSRRIPSQSAPIAQRFVDAGFSIWGKTTLPPYAMDFQTFNKRVGLTRNPWNPDCTAGGSSGGGAAAVATGMSYLDIGADLSGSLRLPAAYCGVCSLMPTDGALPTQGLLPNGAVLDHFARPGPIARAVEDLELAWTVMSGAPGSKSDKSEFKIACWDNSADSQPVASEVSTVFDRACKTLETSDLSVDKASLSSLFNPAVYACFGQIMGYETGGLMPAPIRLLARLTGKSATRNSPNFLAHVHTGYRRNKAAYRQALETRDALRASFENAWAGQDALLLPVCGVQPFSHQTPQSDRGGMRDYTTMFEMGDARVGYFDALTAFTVPVSLMGNPVVTLPLGLDANGLPVGGQLVGRHGGEMALLQLARKVAAALPALQNPYLRA